MKTEEIPDPITLKAMPYPEFLETDYWKWVAKTVKDRDGRRCVVCNSPFHIAAHHRSYKNHGLEHLFLGDLTTLCETCHTRHHFPQNPPTPQINKPKPIKQEVKRKCVVRKQSEIREEREFFRNACRVLCIPNLRLRALGRPETEKLLREKGSHVTSVIPKRCNPPPIERIVGDISSVDRDMPEGTTFILSKPIMDKCRANGVFTTATVKAFGLKPGSLQTGWVERLIGLEISRDQLYQAMRGRHIYAKATFKKRKRGQAVVASLEEMQYNP